MNMTMDMSMQMTFYQDHNFEFLFDSWHVDTEDKYGLALLGLLIFAITLNVVNFLVNYADIKRKQ